MRLYDKVPDVGYNWVAQRPDFKTALRVVKKGFKHPMLSISSCHGSLEYVCQRGVGGVELRAAEVDPHLKRLNEKCSVKNRYSCNFQNIASTTEFPDQKVHICL